MTWKLSACIASHGLKIVDALNLLQEHAVISDLVVGPEDIYDPDCERAVAWLDSHPVEIQEKLSERKAREAPCPI